MSFSCKSQFQPSDSTYNFTQIEAFFIEGSAPFEVIIERVDVPSCVLNSFHLFYDEDYLLINYSADYEGTSISLSFKDINKIFILKDETQIIF